MKLEITHWTTVRYRRVIKFVKLIKWNKRLSKTDRATRSSNQNKWIQ